MYTVFFIQDLTEGSLEAKLPTIWTDGKAPPGRSSDIEQVRDGEDPKGENQKREDANVRKSRKVEKNFVFPMFCGFRRSKSRPAKAAGAELAGQMRGETLHTIVARSTF